MKIRAKLSLLILGVMLLLTSAAALYLALSAVSDRMETEKTYLTALTMAIQDHALAMNRVPGTMFRDTLTTMEARGKVVGQAFQDIEKIETISQLNAEVRNSLGIIKDLRVLLDRRLVSFTGKYKTLLADSKILFTFPDGQRILDFYTYDFRAEKRQYLEEHGLGHLKEFMDDMDIMNDTIQTTTGVIAEQYTLVDGEVAAAKARAIQFSIVVVVIIVMLTLVTALLFANAIAKSIIRIEGNISRLKDGDLTTRTNINSRDEIGNLSRNLNQFSDSLSAAFNQIAGISGSNIAKKDQLIHSTGEVMSAVTEIEANTGSIGNQIHELDRHIDQSTDSISRILTGIQSLNEEIAGQNAMTEQSTAAVTQMLASLVHMSTTTSRDRESVADLVRVSEHGLVVFEQANARIAEIPQHIGTIRDMATVIKTIAAQTNLLAMNAAIEAAHAGDAGMGFAVVAGEIRKLSEASTASSRDIAASIKSIISVIEKASAANAETTDAFRAIEARISAVSKSMEETFQAISEIQVGSQQILSAMVNLRDRSAHVTEDACAMDQAGSAIQQSIGDLNRISNEVSSNITEIAVGINAIGTAIRNVGELSEQVGFESARLDREVNRFKFA